MREITISKRELEIEHAIDKQPISALAAKYGVSTTDLKDSMRANNIKVRNWKEEETKEEESYKINIVA